MFSFSNLPILGHLARNKSDKEFAAATPQSAHGPVPPEAPASAVTSPLEALSQATADSLNAMNDGFDAVLRSMRASGRITKVDEMQLRSQLDYAVGESFKALSEVTLLRRNSELVRLQFDRPGPARRVPGTSAGIEGQQLAMMKAAANATAALDGMAATWRSLPAAADPEIQSVLGNANWHLQALGRNLAASVLAQAIPNSDSRLAGDELHPSTATLRAMVFDSAAGVPAPLQGYVAKMTTSLAHALSDPNMVCVPADETNGIPPGNYPMPEGAPLDREDEWSTDAIRTFTRDIERDTITGGTMTIDGADAISRSTLESCQAARVETTAAVGKAAQDAASCRYSDLVDGAANEAIGLIRAAVPPGLLDTVLGVATQRSVIDLLARFGQHTLGAMKAVTDNRESGLSNFAIRSPASHGKPGVVQVHVSKDCLITGKMDKPLDGIILDTPQVVTLSATFEISPDGITVNAPTAQVQRRAQP